MNTHNRSPELPPYPLLYIQSVVNSTIAQKLSQGVCVPGEEYTDAGCEDDTERNSNMAAYAIFILTNALVGLGTAGTNALGTSYIDENTPTEQTPIYLGKNP